MRIPLVALIVALVSTVAAAPARADALTPIVFVHGQQGSAQQWQSNAKRFSGKLKTRRLAAGRYRVRLTAVDAAGNRSAARTIAMRVVRQ